MYVDLTAYEYNNKFILYILMNLNLFTNYTYVIKYSSSINSLYKYVNSFFFLERELKEMFFIKINNILDTRNLMLDYNKQINPLLKSFNVQGFEEIYLNIFNDKLDYIKYNYIEL